MIIDEVVNRCVVAEGLTHFRWLQFDVDRFAFQKGIDTCNVNFWYLTNVDDAFKALNGCWGNAALGKFSFVLDRFLLDRANLGVLQLYFNS